jgi:hypothetical protein
MRIRTFSMSGALLAIAIATLTACGGSNGSPTGNIAPTSSAAASATATAPAAAATATSTTAKAPDKSQLGQFSDGETVGFRTGNVCIVPVAEIAKATGVDLAVETPTIPPCAYTQSDPSYAVQSINLEVSYVLPQSAAVDTADGTPLAGFPTGSRGFLFENAYGNEVGVYLPSHHLFAQCWTVGQDDQAVARTQLDLCRWIATGDHLLRHIPRP